MGNAQNIHRNKTWPDLLSAQQTIIVTTAHTKRLTQIVCCEFCYITVNKARYRMYQNADKHDDVIKWKHFRVTGPLCGEFTGLR